MTFKEVNILCDFYHDMIESSNDFSFDEVEKEREDFKLFLDNLSDLTEEQRNDLLDNAMSLAVSFEQQGYVKGCVKGMSTQKQADAVNALVNERT